MATSGWLTSRHRTAMVAAAMTTALVAVPVLSPDVTASQAADPLAAARVADRHVLIAGHRGDKAGAPENTLAAMRLAIAGDADFVETDLQLTADGVPVLMHDWTLDRTTDGSGPVWALTWEQLSDLDAGAWYAPEFRGTRVPRLEEFLDLVAPSQKRIILEVKGSWNAAQLAPVVAEIQSRRLDERVIVASFDIVSLRHLRSVAPDIPRAVIARQVVGDPAILAGTCGAIVIVTSSAFAEQQPDAVARIQDAGLGVLLYTLNDADTWTEAITLGVDGIITDRPGELDRWLATDQRAMGLPRLDRAD
ncbi:MAG: glycerophosphodiester phosphodiesterase family protein [Rhodoglobus sp.]